MCCNQADAAGSSKKEDGKKEKEKIKALEGTVKQNQAALMESEKVRAELEDTSKKQEEEIASLKADLEKVTASANLIFGCLFAPEFLVHSLIRLVRIDESRPGRKD